MFKILTFGSVSGCAYDDNEMAVFATAIDTTIEKDAARQALVRDGWAITIEQAVRDSKSELIFWNIEAEKPFAS